MGDVNLLLIRDRGGILNQIKKKNRHTLNLNLVLPSVVVQLKRVAYYYNAMERGKLGCARTGADIPATQPRPSLHRPNPLSTPLA